MQREGVIDRIGGWFWNLLLGFVVICFVMMLIIMLTQIISRYLLGIAVPWTDEASRYFYIGEIFIGAAIAQRNHDHIRITVLTDLISRPIIQRITNVVKDLVMLFVLLLVAGGSWGMIGKTKGIFASTFDFSFSHIYTIQFVSACIMSLLLLRDLVYDTAGIVTRKSVPETKS